MAHAQRPKQTLMGCFFAVPVGYTPMAHYLAPDFRPLGRPAVRTLQEWTALPLRRQYSTVTTTAEQLPLFLLTLFMVAMGFTSFLSLGAQGT